MAESRCMGCGADLKPGNKFCMECGLPVQASAPSTKELRSDQVGPRYSLVLVRGDGGHASTYALGGQEHVAGKDDGIILFPDDPTVSPVHCTFFYRDGRLMVRDENSRNGTFVRVTTPVALKSGDHFIAGEQVFVYEDGRTVEANADDQGTFFFGTPIAHWYFKLTQVLQGGKPGSVFCARKARIVIGRDGTDFNFPDDRFMSGKHVAVEFKDSAVWLADLESRNGSFLKLRPAEERILNNGDYLFIGRQLVKVVQ